MARVTCRSCGSPLDESGYCTSTEWCTYSDRLQQGSPPGARGALDRAHAAWEAAGRPGPQPQLSLFPEPQGVEAHDVARGRR
jgi:hypothetical protein